MSWFQRLYKTYKKCVTASEQSAFAIAPVGHTHKVCNIEIRLNEKAEMTDAQIINKDTIIPTTDDNSCLWSFAVDIKTYQKEKGKDDKELKVTYKKQLNEWAEYADASISSSTASTKKIQIVNEYIQKNTLIQDLKNKEILWLDNDGEFIEKPKKKKDIEDKYKIFECVNVKKQEDVFIRWVVGTDKEGRNTWENKEIIKSWINFRKQKENKKYESEIEKTYRKDKENNIVKRLKDDKICCITGKTDCIATNHPFSNGTSKLIAVGDDLVFKGKFKEYYEALSVSFDVSQKAHNTLKWLIAKERGQAYRNYPQIIVAFTINGRGGNIGEVFGKDFVKSIEGYSVDFEEFEQDENIVLLEMNAASPGRACIAYYKELLGSQYLKNVKNWHKKYYWQQFLKIKNKDNQKEEYQYFYGTPSINTIATVYFYKKDRSSVEKNEQKIKSKLIRDLMPSVLENKNIPEYIEKHFIEKASNPVALNNNQWKTILRIACSIYKGNHLYDENKKEEDYLMLNEENDTRDYLYGRLLAIVDYAEEKSLWEQQKLKKMNLENDEGTDEDKDKYNSVRITNAKRYMRQFTLKPYSTWQMLLLRYNEAYMPRLKKNNPGLEIIIDKLRIEIENKFMSEGDYQNDNKLAGIYQLAYSCQMYKLRKYNKGNI